MKNTPHRIALIMSGGSGERFWPLSRATRPKQFLPLAGGGATLLEKMIEAAAPVVPVEDMFIATGVHLAEATRRLVPSIPAGNYFLEPARRNTSGCLALAAAGLLARYGGDGSEIIVVVLASDHRVGDADRFRDTLRSAFAAAESHDALVTLGIAPDRPETGYGYIEASPARILVPGTPPGAVIRRVAGFREKPDRASAESFLADRRFFWNSGMFFWRLSVFLRELETAAPDIAAAIPAMADALRRNDTARLHEAFLSLPDISIDYALMEKARNVLVVRADFGWDDIGAWDALDRSMPRDASGNVTVGDPFLSDVRDSVVYNEQGAEKRAVAVIGVEGLAVVITEDAVLVVPKDRAQEVRGAVAALKERGKEKK